MVSACPEKRSGLIYAWSQAEPGEAELSSARAHSGDSCPQASPALARPGLGEWCGQHGKPLQSGFGRGVARTGETMAFERPDLNFNRIIKRLQF